MKNFLRVSWKRREHIFQNKSVWTKVLKGLLLGAFVVGIFAANLMGQESISNAGILNDYFIGKFQYSQINGENLFFYIIGERIPMLILLLLLVFSSLGVICGVLVLGWQGFSIGFMLSTGIAKYGIKGMLLVLGGLFPQYLIYLPVYIFYCYLAIFLRQRLYGEGKMVSSDQKYVYSAGLLAMIVLLLIYITGIFLESYINPIILKNILKFF